MNKFYLRGLLFSFFGIVICFKQKNYGLSDDLCVIFSFAFAWIWEPALMSVIEEYKEKRKAKPTKTPL